jgi:flagellar biosynthesis/type III secretory pathway chaperone
VRDQGRPQAQTRRGRRKSCRWAAGVSHDLRNILNPLSLHLQIVQRALDRSQISDAGETIPEMKQVLVRGLQTLERLRDYSLQTKEAKTELVHLDRLAERWQMTVRVCLPKSSAA